MGCNASGPEAVVSDAGLDPGRAPPADDHRPGVRPRQRRAGQLPGAAADRAEERHFRIGVKAGACDIGRKILLEIMAARHLVPLATLLA